MAGSFGNYLRRRCEPAVQQEPAEFPRAPSLCNFCYFDRHSVELLEPKTRR